MYRKYKDSSPENTIFNIISQLHNAGIVTVYEFNNNAVDGCYSNRITIDGTNFGSNGKGTSKTYALASGYAELMERLQNNMFYVGEHNTELYVKYGFYYSPDEKIENTRDYSLVNNSFMEYIYKLNKCINSYDRLSLLSLSVNDFNRVKGIECEKIVTVPFYSLKTKKIEYLPYNIYSCVYGSNGMSAGNTIEEAMVQGLSEIYERYVNKKLLKEDITPPDIPHQYIKKNVPYLYRIIEEISSGGKYKVIVKDLSLKKKFPVIGTIIIDTYNGNFGFRLGAHPSFAVALERTLTEAFQGRSIENFVNTAKIGTDSQSSADSNIQHIFKNGEGFYRESLFRNEPDYPFIPFDNVNQMDNKNLAKNMIQPLLNNGYDVLVRNSGFMNLPALQIIVPGINEIRNFNEINIKCYNTKYKIADSINNGKAYEPQNIKRILKYVEYMYFSGKLGDVVSNRLFSRPINNMLMLNEYDSIVFIAIMYLSQGNVNMCLNLLKRAFLEIDNSDEKIFVKAMILSVEMQNDNKSKENTLNLLKSFYSKDIYEKTIECTFEPEKTIKNFFDNMKCWDCDNCEYNKTGKCTYKVIYNVFYNLRAKMLDNFPKQEKLGQYF